jgi:hypothetical protein
MTSLSGDGIPPQPPGSWRRLVNWYLRHRFSVLFSTLLLTFVAAPVAAEYRLRSGPIELLLTLTLGAAAFGMARSRLRSLLLSMVLITALLRYLGRSLHLQSVSSVAVALFVVLAVAAVFGTLRFALKGREVASEHVSAALSAYLLAGLVFGIAFFEIEAVRPGSSTMGGQAFSPGQFSLQTSIYFSFATLATLGYGDIIPVTPTTRGLTISLAIIGQLYLAVLVARLVAATATRQRRE